MYGVPMRVPNSPEGEVGVATGAHPITLSALLGRRGASTPTPTPTLRGIALLCSVWVCITLGRVCSRRVLAIPGPAPAPASTCTPRATSSIICTTSKTPKDAGFLALGFTKVVHSLLHCHPLPSLYRAGATSLLPAMIRPLAALMSPLHR
jgi:hypothetical protein